MPKRSKRMPKLMTLRVGCAELLQAARSHPGCSPPLTNPPRIICVIPPKSVSRFFAPPLPIASLFRWNFACFFFRRKQRDEMELPLASKAGEIL